MAVSLTGRFLLRGTRDVIRAAVTIIRIASRGLPLACVDLNLFHDLLEIAAGSNGVEVRIGIDTCRVLEAFGVGLTEQDHSASGVGVGKRRVLMSQFRGHGVNAGSVVQFIGGGGGILGDCRRVPTRASAWSPRPA